MKISEVMNKNVITVRPDATVNDVACLLAEHSISGMPVVDDSQRVVGLVTERDLLPKMSGIPFSNVRLPALFGEWLGEEEFEEIIRKAKDRKVTEVMNESVLSINADESISKAASMMAQNSVKRLPVVRDNRLVGIITRADVIRAIAERGTDD